MNEQNEPSNTCTPVILPAKRKRGRPRKDGNLPKKDEGSSNPALLTSVNEGMRTFQHIESKPNDGSMIGRMVSGVIDGSFDAGYFLSVRIGNTGPFLRGVIFEPGRFTPVTLSNDIAPQAKMFQRREVPIPIPSPQNRVNDVGSQSVGKQPVQLGMQQPVVLSQVLPSVPQPGPSLVLRSQSPPTMVPIVNMSRDISSPTLAEKMVMQQTPRSTYGNQFQSSPPVENLRMVEQDDAMQVYEVSVQSEGLLVDTEPAKDMISESSSEPRTNNVLHHKEITNQVDQSHNQDIGSGLSARIHNEFNCLATENHVALETQNGQSELKQNQDPYYELRQHTVVDAPQTLPQKLPVIESGFQPRDLIQNKVQDINLVLHETPVVTQTQYVSIENPHVEPENEIRRPDHKKNETSLNTPHSVSMEPANMEDQLDPGKLVHNELRSENHGIQEAFVPANSYLLPRELFSQSVESMNEKPNTPENDSENSIELQPEAKISETNQSIHSGKPIHDSTGNGEIDSQTTERAREAMPFDLEIAAEETTWPGRPENQVSAFTACTTELNLVPGNAVLRTATENNPGCLPESQQR